MDVKKCAACGQEKPLSAFTKRSGSSSRRGTCRACLRQRQREHWSQAGERLEADVGSDEVARTLTNSEGSPPKRKRRRKRRSRGSKQRLGLQAASIESESTSNQLDQLLPSEGESENQVKLISEMTPSSKNKRKRRRKRQKSSAARLKQGHVENPSAHTISVIRPPDKSIEPLKGPFTYKTSILNDRGKGMIRLRGHRETGKRWSTEIPTEMAVRMVEEGAAGIISPGLIHKLYTKTDFRLLVLQRDHYICHYCGRFGDTIDHVMPKSKGGLSTPANCVCACAECNLKKADSLDFVYDDFI